MDATMRWTKVIRASLVRVVLACVLATVCGNHMSPEWQALILAVQKNPGLMEVLRTNPTLTRSLYSGLGLSANRARQDRCEELKQENVRLRQMIEAMIGGDLPINLAGSHPDLRALERSQRELSPVQKLFNQLQSHSGRVSVQSTLVTPKPSWTTIVETSSYETTLTKPVFTEVPIIWRGSRVTTTIEDTTVVTVTATEMRTESTLISPSPTWVTRTVTVQPTAIPVVKDRLPVQAWPRHPVVLPNLALDTLKTKATPTMERLRRLYGTLSARRAVQTGPRPPVVRNPIFDDYEYFDEDDDHQRLADHVSPVSVRSSMKPTPSTTTQVLTLYFSGKVPGEYSTSLSTVTKTVSSSQHHDQEHAREKRRAIDKGIYQGQVPILPTKVETVLTTIPSADLRLQQPPLSDAGKAVVTIESSFKSTVPS